GGAVPSRGRLSLLAAFVALLAVASAASACPSPTPMTAPTTPASARPPTPAERAGAMSDVDLVGQVLMPSVNMDDPVDGSVRLLRQDHLGGLIPMRNVANPPA